MTPVARVLGLVLPACAAEGAQGVPLPPVDLVTLRRSIKWNSALAAPPGFRPASGRPPEITTGRYPIPAVALLASLRVVAAHQSRTRELDHRAAGPRRADWVARSALCNFPDLISAQVADVDPGTGPGAGPAADPAADPAAGQGGSTLILFSRSLYGYVDFGVNARRVAAWLDALQIAGA